MGRAPLGAFHWALGAAVAVVPPNQVVQLVQQRRQAFSEADHVEGVDRRARPLDERRVVT